MKINRKKVMGLIDTSNGKIFTAIFIKKNGDVRRIICRASVSKGVTGKGMSYDPRSKGLVPVFDMKEQSFKMININTMSNINVGGVRYDVI